MMVLDFEMSFLIEIHESVGQIWVYFPVVVATASGGFHFIHHKFSGVGREWK